MQPGLRLDCPAYESILRHLPTKQPTEKSCHGNCSESRYRSVAIGRETIYRWMTDLVAAGRLWRLTP